MKDFPNHWDWVRLGDHVKKIGSGLTPRGGESVYLQSGIPFIRSQNVHLNRFEMNGLVFISPEQDQEMKDTRVLADDVLLNITGASIGRVCIAPKKMCPANVNQHVCIIRSNGSIDSRFLVLFLSTPDFQRFIVDNQSGATRQALTKAQIEDFLVPLPPIEEQKRIATIAQKADRLRRTRRYTLELSDSYLQSVFLEMFGDPVTNSKGWRSYQLEEVCDDITVGFVGQMTHEYVDKGIPFLRSQNVLPFSLDLTSVKYISSDFHSKLKKSALTPGDVVVVRTGNAGDACVIPHSLPIANCADLVIIKPGKAINSHYLTCLFNSTWGQGSVTGNLVGQIQQHFNIGAAKEMLVHLPPLPLQEKFAQIVQRFERLRTQQREAERQAEHLFQTILHRAFRGEL